MHGTADIGEERCGLMMTVMMLNALARVTILHGCCFVYLYPISTFSPSLPPPSLPPPSVLRQPPLWSYVFRLSVSGGMHGDGETPMINGDIDDRRYVSSSPSSSFKEDSVEIDALLSMDDEYDDVVDDGGGGGDDDDDDVMSTGRTPGSYNSCCSSPDSACSTLATRKKARVKKMVKALRGIVPGGEQMETPVFLDEAVKYLKSLKMEVSKLGIPKTVN